MKWLVAATLIVCGCSAGQIVDDTHPDLAHAATDDLPSSPKPDLAKSEPQDLAGPTPDDLASPPDLVTTGPAGKIGPLTLTFDLDAGAFPAKPGQPSALVYIPSNFDPTPPYDLIVYIHGFNNCVVNIVKETGAACTPGGGVRGASNLINQLETANKNAILIAPEVKFDQATGDPGKLGKQDGFKNFLTELLGKLGPSLSSAPVTLADIRHIVLYSHSGGYWALAEMATVGGVDSQEVNLLDSLYGYETTFKSWIMSDPAAFEAAPIGRRFFSIYTATGGTDDNNMAMAKGAASWDWLNQSAIAWDDTTSTWTLDQFSQHGVNWKRTSLSHSGTVTYYFQRLVQTSTLLVDKN